MDAAAREELVRQIEAQPERYVAQEQVALSTAPVCTEHGPGAAPRRAARLRRLGRRIATR